jgi:hypothetical protein
MEFNNTNVLTDRPTTQLMLAENRVEEQEIKAVAQKPYMEAPETVTPEDIKLMYAGGMVDDLLKQRVRSSNKLYGFQKAYGHVHPYTMEELEKQKEEFLEGFSKAKTRLTRIASNHPLAQRLCGIKGFTAYQLALVMTKVKDISRFDTPSKLVIYAGCGSKYGMFVCKRNLNAIRKIHAEQYTGDPDAYRPFGYNTALQQRLYIITDSLIRAKGWFYEFYQRQRERIEEKAINEDRVFVATAEDAKGTKMKAGEFYMKGRNTQSLKAWSNSGARWRVARTLLHLIYKEWRDYKGLECRNPYPIEYLGHSQLITLDDVLARDEKK